MPTHWFRYCFTILVVFAFLLLATGARAQTLLVDTGSPHPPAATSLDAPANCTPQPACFTFFQYWAGQFTLVHAASIDSVQVWMGPIFIGGSIAVKLYADGGGIPGVALYSQTYTLSSNSIDGWVPFAFANPHPTLTAGTYWLAVEPVVGTGFSTNMDGGAPNPLARYAVWNGSFGYRAFVLNIWSFGMRVSGTNFPDIAFGAVGRATVAGSSYGVPFSYDNIIGGVGTPNTYLGAGEIPAGWAIIRGSLFPNSLNTGAWSATSTCNPIFGTCTAGSGSARSVVFRTWTNPTSGNLTFGVNALLHGTISNFGGIPGSAIGRVYVFDSTMFTSTLSAHTDAAQFLVNTVPVSQDLNSLFPSGAILASISQTLTGPLDTGLIAPLTTNLVTIGAGKSITVMFDVTTITPEGNSVDFFSTLAPAPVLFTDQSNNPVTQLVAAGPAVPAPVTPTSLTLTPASNSSPLGTTTTLTATATRDSGTTVVPGAIVYFRIWTGPNAGAPVPSITDANGQQATFSYTDAKGAGTDAIQANIGSLQSSIVQQTWTTPGPLHHITISPANATIPPGGSQPYTAQGFDVFNNSLGDVTAATTFTISPDGSCTVASCTASIGGQHTVTGSDSGKSANAGLLVNAGKLDTTSTVASNHNPSILGQSITFTATVSASSGTPTGTVNFKDGSSTLASGVALSSGMATFTTSSLSIGSHSITAVYNGDANFNATGTGTSSATAVTQLVQYGVCLTYDPARSVKSGATYPLKMYLCDANSSDVSSSGIIVHATSIFKTSSYSGAPEDAGNSNPDSDFRYDPTIGPSGGYIFNLKTSGLAGGTYGFAFTATTDPTTHTVMPGFGVK